MQVLNDFRSCFTQIAQMFILISQSSITLVGPAALCLQPLTHVLTQRNGAFIDVPLRLLKSLVGAIPEVVIAHLGWQSLFGDLGFVEGLPVFQHLRWLLVLISQLYPVLLGGKHALGDLRPGELGGRGGEELLFIEGVFQEVSRFIVFVFFVLAVVALIVGQVGRVELVLMQRSRGQLALLRRQEVRLKFWGWGWQLLLNGPVEAHNLRERVKQITEFGRQVFMLLILPHAIDDLGVGFYLGLGHDVSDEFEEVVLQGEDEFGEEGVVLLLIFAGGEAAVYRHQTIIFEARSRHNHISGIPIRIARREQDQSYKSSLNITLNHPSSFLLPKSSIFPSIHFHLKTHRQAFQTI